jgi:hypothetical protein
MDLYSIKIPKFDSFIGIRATSEAEAIRKFKKLSNIIIEGITATKVVKNGVTKQSE